MPLPVFFAAMAGVTIVNLAINVLLLRLVAKVFKGPKPPWARCVAVVIVMFGAGSAATLVKVWFGLSAALIPVALACIGLYYLAFRIGLRIRGMRSIGAFAAFVAGCALINFPLAFALKFTLIDSFVQATGGMSPTLVSGDRFLVDRTMMPFRWDATVFRAPMSTRDIYVQRCVGLPGETIEIVDGEIKINGVVIPKPADLQSLAYDGRTQYIGLCRGGTGSPFTLGPDEYFVLGDNTKASLDSRYWTSTGFAGHQVGAVPASAIVGTARAIYAPWGRMRIFR